MTVSIYSQSASPLGLSIYRLDGVAAPAQFIPTLVFESKANGTGTNNWVRVDSTYPLVAVVDGVTTQTGAFRMKTEFTSLQNVIADTERDRLFTEHVAFLTANKAKILAGKVV